MRLAFSKLIGFLEKRGYEVEVTSYRGYSFAVAKGNNIHAAFATVSDEAPGYLSGKIAADNSRCFDEWYKCPLIMRLPVDSKILLKHFEFLASEEGFKISNSYSYLDDNPFPFEL